MSWDHTFGPTKFNHFYAGGNNWRQNHESPQEYIGNWKDKFCLPNVPDCNLNLVNFGFSNGYGGWGGPANNGSENTVYGFNDDFTWVKGKHTFKFGGMYQLTHYNGFGRQCVSGCANFSFTETGRGGDTNFGTAGGNPFASFLLGYADSGSLDTIRFIGQQWPYFAGYVQDDWRVSHKLTVNYGVRWENQLPSTGLNDAWSDFSPTTPNPAANNIPGAVIFAGSGTGRIGSRTLADSYFKAFGPRFGFAYQANEKTVIRGGAGISYGADHHGYRLHAQYGLYPDPELQQLQQRHHTDLHPRTGVAAMDCAAVHQPLGFERSQRVVVSGPRRHPSARGFQHQPVHPAPVEFQHGSRSLL